MHLYGDLPPVLSGVHDQLGGRIGQHEVMHALTVDLDRARLDFARGVRDRLREAGLGEQLVDPNAGGGAYAFRQRHCLYVRRNFVTAHYAVELLLRAPGVRGGVEIGYDHLASSLSIRMPAAVRTPSGSGTVCISAGTS